MATATPHVLFPWNQSYSVGVEQIDKQHQGLIQLINQLHAAMTAGHAADQLGPTLDELVRYTDLHFNYEETFLRQRGYAGLEAHHNVHENLKKQVRELRDKFHAKQLSLTVQVMMFLKNWLADHIMVHDQAYARALKTR